jgi:hypothetical protein
MQSTYTLTNPNLSRFSLMVLIAGKKTKTTAERNADKQTNIYKFYSNQILKENILFFGAFFVVVESLLPFTEMRSKKVSVKREFDYSGDWRGQMCHKI